RALRAASPFCRCKLCRPVVPVVPVKGQLIFRGRNFGAVMQTLQERVAPEMDVRTLLAALTALKKGDFSVRLPQEWTGMAGKVARDQLGSFVSEATCVAREVGTEGKLGGQAKVKGVAGTWRDLTDSVNFMASNLTRQVRNFAEVTTSVANGDRSKKITVDVR